MLKAYVSRIYNKLFTMISIFTFCELRASLKSRKNKKGIKQLERSVKIKCINKIIQQGIRAFIHKQMNKSNNNCELNVY